MRARARARERQSDIVSHVSHASSLGPLFEIESRIKVTNTDAFEPASFCRVLFSKTFALKRLR